MYKFKKDPTIATTSKSKLWNTGYNIEDDVFRSTILSHINKSHHQEYENELLDSINGIKSKCVICKEDMIYIPNHRSLKSSIKQLSCESCTPQHKINMMESEYIQQMILILTKMSLDVVKEIETTLNKFL